MSKTCLFGYFFDVHLRAPCFPACFGIFLRKMSDETKTAEKTAGKKKEKLKEPEEYQVVLLNDDYTTMDFVVHILEMIFHKSSGEASRIMLDVHRLGRGVVGVYPWDIAQTRTAQVHAAARQREFPLRCIVEQV
jgi:ATP-dependent Clp protease adaptor protein ClpS